MPETSCLCGSCGHKGSEGEAEKQTAEPEDTKKAAGRVQLGQAPPVQAL